MQVVLLRHGIAGSRDERRWPDDSSRPLTSRGRERTAQAAAGLTRLVAITRILSSPLVRAHQSAEILREAADLSRPIETSTPLSPGGSTAELLKRLRALRANECVALVGHEPDLGRLAAALCFKAAGATLPLKKAGACIIDFIGHPERGAGRLLAFLPPRMLRRRTRRRVNS